MKYLLNRKEVLTQVKEYLNTNAEAICEKFINENNFNFINSDDVDLELYDLIDNFHERLYNATFDYIHDEYIKKLYDDEEIIKEAQLELVHREDALLYNSVIGKTKSYARYITNIFNEVNCTKLPCEF